MVLDQDTFIKLIKGQLIDDQNFKNFYQIHNYNGIDEKTILIDSSEIDSIFISETIDCKYSLVIRNSKIQSLRIKDGIFPSISFDNIEFDHEGLFQIDGGHFIRFYLSGSVSKSWYINEGFFKSFYVGNLNFNSLSINGGTFDDIYLSGIRGKGIFFRDGDYQILRIAGGAEANDCMISGLYFNGGRFNQVAIFGLSNIEKCYITSGRINTLTLQSEGLKNILLDGLIHSYKQGEEIIVEPQLQIQNIFVEQLNKINIFIKDVNVQLLNFSNSYLSKDSVVRISNIKTKCLKFESFINYGLITFNKTDISVDDKFIITYTDLGKTTFINCDFHRSIFTIISSKITEVFISGTQMPERIIEGSDEDKRLGYAQIKKIYDSRGDSVGYTVFFSHEMNAYFDTLIFKNNPWDYINVFINKHSTNHGQSWQKGIAWLFGLSLFLYFIYCYFLGFKFSANFNNTQHNYFPELASYYFDFLNPAHKTDLVADGLKGNISAQTLPYARLIEGFSRIPIAYLIYQIIQAFRKFARK